MRVDESVFGLENRKWEELTNVIPVKFPISRRKSIWASEREVGGVYQDDGWVEGSVVRVEIMFAWL